MDALHKIQNKFLDYLLDDTQSDIVEQIESDPKHSAKQRMTFYGNAYVLRLKEALMTDYEVLHSYLGDEHFENLMQCYIQKYPSQHTSLRYFGQHMIELTEQQQPYNQLPEVAEIAKIEQAFANSFDAADCSCVSLNQLAELKPEAWASLTLRFNNAVQLVPQHYNSFQIWQALNNEEHPPEKQPDDTTWLIYRQELVSRYRALEPAELSALTIAMSSGNFSELCEALLEHFSEEETPQHAVAYLQQWINDQMVCEIC